MTDFLAKLDDRLDPRHTAVLIVDVQNDFAHPDSMAGRHSAFLAAAEAAIDRLEWLIERARALGLPVMHLRAHYDDRYQGAPMAERLTRRGGGDRCVSGTWGADFYRLIPRAGEYVISKHRYSGFVGTDLEMILHRNAIKTLVVGGLTTDVCVESTVRDAFHRDFYVVVVQDGCATPDSASHEASLSIMGRMFADVVPAADIVAAWERALVATSGSRRRTRR